MSESRSAPPKSSRCARTSDWFAAGAVSARERRNGGVVEWLEPVLDVHWCKAQLHVQLDVVFKAVHGVLVEQFAVHVLEQLVFKHAPPVVRQVQVIRVLNDFDLVKKAAE